MDPDYQLHGTVYTAGIRSWNSRNAPVEMAALLFRGDSPISYDRMITIIEKDNGKKFKPEKVENSLYGRTEYKFKEFQPLLTRFIEDSPGKPDTNDTRVFTFFEFITWAYKIGVLTSRKGYEKLLEAGKGKDNKESSADRKKEKSTSAIKESKKGSSTVQESEKEKFAADLPSGSRQLVTGLVEKLVVEEEDNDILEIHNTTKFDDVAAIETVEENVVETESKNEANVEETNKEVEEERVIREVDVDTLEGYTDRFNTIHEIMPASQDVEDYKTAFFAQKAHYFDFFDKTTSIIEKKSKDNFYLMRSLDLEREKLRSYNTSAAENIANGLAPVLKSNFTKNSKLVAESCATSKDILGKIESLAEGDQNSFKAFYQDLHEVADATKGLSEAYQQDQSKIINFGAMLQDIHKAVVKPVVTPSTPGSSSFQATTPISTPSSKKRPGPEVGVLGGPPKKVSSLSLKNPGSLPSPSPAALAAVMNIRLQTQPSAQHTLQQQLHLQGASQATQQNNQQVFGSLGGLVTHQLPQQMGYAQGVQQHQVVGHSQQQQLQLSGGQPGVTAFHNLQGVGVPTVPIGGVNNLGVGVGLPQGFNPAIQPPHPAPSGFQDHNPFMQQ